jgi:uncharacterized surface protein with fasciclin (FAS1) repeats
MKKTMYTFCVVTLLLFGITGCDKYDVMQTPETPVNNVLRFVNTDTNYSLFSIALLKAGVARQETFANSNITFFAPDNNAFREQGLTSATEINNLRAGYVDSVIRYHVLNTIFKPAALPAGPNAELTPLFNTTRLYVTKTNNDVFINGNKISQIDSTTRTNGIIYKTNLLMLPPVQNLLSTLGNDPNYDRLRQAITKCGLTSVFTGMTIYTLFAPTNTAFLAANLDSTNIANASGAALTSLTNALRLHVIIGRAFSNNVTDGGTLPTAFTGNSLTTNVNGNVVTVRGIGNGNMPATVTKANTITSNGVIHRIDKVLLP